MIVDVQLHDINEHKYKNLKMSYYTIYNMIIRRLPHILSILCCGGGEKHEEDKILFIYESNIELQILNRCHIIDVLIVQVNIYI